MGQTRGHTTRYRTEPYQFGINSSTVKISTPDNNYRHTLRIRVVNATAILWACLWGAQAFEICDQNQTSEMVAYLDVLIDMEPSVARYSQSGFEKGL